MIQFLTVFLQITGGSSVKSQLSTIISEYGVPVLVFLMVLSAVFGVVKNYDLLVDSEGQGTRKEGIKNVLIIFGVTVVVLAAISAIVLLISGLKITV